MITKKNSKLIFYLDRQKLIIASTQLAAPLTLEFPMDIVLDIDVINPESFELLLSNFFEQSKINPADVLLVISPEVYYEKKATLSTDPKERQNQIDIFLQTVPFKNLIFKDYLLGGQPRLITLNKNFYEPIVRFFEKNNFKIVAIMPFFVLENFQLSFSDYLPLEVKNIYKKYKLIEPYSLITIQDINKISTSTIRRPKENNRRTFILLIIFFILVVILLIYKFIVPKFIKPPQPKISSNPSLVITPTPSIDQISPTPTINYISQDTLRIKIVNSSGASNQAAKIKQLLIKDGFKEIFTASSSVVTAAKNKISFSSLVSPESRQKIRETVENIAGPSTEIELVEVTDFDILITTTFKSE